jgi:hypothetical protein
MEALQNVMALSTVLSMIRTSTYVHPTPHCKVLMFHKSKYEQHFELYNRHHQPPSLEDQMTLHIPHKQHDLIKRHCEP